MTGNTVIYCDENIGLVVPRHLDNLWRQPITIFEPVGHQEINVASPEGSQCEHCNSNTGGAISIKVTDN